MKRKLMHFASKYKEIILYCFFGGLTTLINIITYFILTRSFGINYLVSTIVSWILSVLFAYITNKIFVFKSNNVEIRYVIKEITAFVGFRLLSGILDIGIMYVFVDLFGVNDFLIKIISNVIVIIMNYIFSKLVIFNHGLEE